MENEMFLTVNLVIRMTYYCLSQQSLLI